MISVLLEQPCSFCSVWNIYFNVATGVGIDGDGLSSDISFYSLLHFGLSAIDWCLGHISTVREVMQLPTLA